MALTTIRAKIKEILLAVSGIGTKVYDYEVYTDDWASFLNKFKTGSIVKGFEFHRRATPEEAHTTRVNIRTHNFFFRGYYSLGADGATLKDFQALLESIATAFRTKPDLDATCQTNSPMQIDLVENRMFGETLCHYAEFRLLCEEEEQWTET